MAQTLTVVCVSDHTGLTAEAFAHSLISRFPQIKASYLIRPFVDSAEKAHAVVDEIDALGPGTRPIVFTTFSNTSLQDIVAGVNGMVINLFAEWLDRVSVELNQEPSSQVSHYHGVGDVARYQLRLDAVDFALMTDDGLGVEHYPLADIILVGVSRVGKTPSCLYLSMHYGIRAANYPLSLEDHEGLGFPETLRPHRERLYGLTIEPRRLSAIRLQRRADGAYSSLELCKRELRHTEQLFRAEGIPYLDSTSRSIEEIAATIIEDTGISRRI
ncbi:MAG: pyruvate, water dikinase regulatory protein [Acidimicrobiia bacterium]|nr:MAG: pyruvate, water dikinase regulatory protein [Acidimicrobiia bacterium]